MLKSGSLTPGGSLDDFEGEPGDEGSGFEDEDVDVDSEYDTPVSRKKKKFRKNARLTLSDEQEVNLVEWLKVHPELYDKGSKEYKDVDLKNKLWEDKAVEIGVESRELLLVWYTSMRTRFGKLRKIKMANENKRFSSREQWILDNFDFMTPHIYVCPSRSVRPSTLKRKMQQRSARPALQPESGSENDVDFVDDIYNLPTTTHCSTPMTSYSPPMFAAVPPDPANQGDSMAKGYGTFLSTFVPSLHPTLLTQFYQESWGLVMRYHAQSESLKEDDRQRSTIPVAVKRSRLPPHMQGSNQQTHIMNHSDMM